MIALWLLACVAEPEGITFEDDVLPMLRTECVSCHRGEQPEGALDLGYDPFGALVDAPSTQSSLLLVEPYDHLYSYLWHKVNGTQSLAGGSGTRMPLDAPLDAELIDLVGRWIDEGARP